MTAYPERQRDRFVQLREEVMYGRQSRPAASGRGERCRRLASPAL
jgi:hypothetical protein